MSRDDEILDRLDRIAGLLERMVTPPVTVTVEPAPEPAKPRPPIKDLASVRHRDFTRPVEDEWDGRDGPPPAGGTDPAEWRKRPDPDAAAMRRTKRLPMGRPLR